MRALEYKKLYAVETNMWWFRALHKSVLGLLPHAEGETVLDVGCGTGGLLNRLSETGYLVTGIDYSAHGLEFAKQKTADVVRGSANALPFVTFFDRLVCVDVLEVSTVDPHQLVRNAMRVLKPGGYAVFVMAAHQWLLSEHDRAVDSVRRFNRRQLEEIFANSNAQIVRSTYLFLAMFPFVALRKLLNRKKDTDIPESDVSAPHPLINEMLYFVCSLEAFFLPWFSWPMGSSVAVVVRKSG
jgi:SAM-dependent methyltransferase